ncbi:MAG: hypothetical protein EOO68_21465 [Moraxellaceae bacterium]|nr:MAG: hypothetical protein EOO68_21465 [Moraxellaceae bacterium]
MKNIKRHIHSVLIACVALAMTSLSSCKEEKVFPEIVIPTPQAIFAPGLTQGFIPQPQNRLTRIRAPPA